MELASKWDSLTSLQQRYIATQAAGSRQQSRFIALMSDYARTQELVGKAYNANGASARQFEKTQDSLESKLARLKNAWNEFLMGLTNNQMVKGFVDVLTNLLNFINKLTSGFNATTNSILKFGVALGGIFGARSLLSTGGLVDKGLMALLSGTGIGNALNKAGIISGTKGSTGGASLFSKFKSIPSSITSFKKGAIDSTWYLNPNVQSAHQNYLNLRRNSPNDLAAISVARNEYIRQKGLAGGNGAKTLFGAIGNNFINTGIGRKLSANLGSALGKIGIGSGAALGGATTLAATLGTITVAAVAMGAALKKAYDTSPAGQLKTAEKYADALSNIADNAKKVASQMQDATRQIKDYEDAIINATTVSERSQAIQNQNEYILSLLEQDATYAQFIQSTFGEGNQLYLTLDSAALAKAVDEIAKGATRASAYDNFADAIVSQQTADFHKSQLNGINLRDRTRLVTDTTTGNLVEVALSDADFKKYSEDQAKIDTANIARQNYAATAASQIISLEDSNLDNELANLISSVIGQTFDAEDTFKKAINQKKENWLDGKATDAQLRQAYSDIYGTDLDESYDKSEVQYAIALGQVLKEEIDGQIPELLNIVKSANGKLLLEVISGSYEGVIDDGKLRTAFESLSAAQQAAIEALLKTNGDATFDALYDYNAQLKKAQTEFKKKAVDTLYKSGLQGARQLDLIVNKLTISQQKKLVEIADKLTDYGTEFSGKLLEFVSTAMLEGEYDKVFQDFTASLTDNPVLTFQALKEAAESTNPELKEIVKNLGLINDSGQFDASGIKALSNVNQVQWFLTSNEYDGLADSISKLVEENGHLTSNNIEKIATESETLSTLLDNNIISVKGLANALNALQEGKITVFDLNENVLKLFNSFDTVSNAVSRAGQFIRDFNPGEDWGDAFDFIENATERMNELVKNRELGNPQLKNYWETFFTTDPSDLADWEAGIALIERLQSNGGESFWTEVAGFTADETGYIADMGLDDFEKSKEYNNYAEYIKSLAKDNGYENFADTYYDLMIRNAANHDYGFFEKVAAIEVKKIVSAYGEGLANGKPSKADIQSIADAYGYKPQDILDAYTDYFGLESLDFSSLDDKIRQFNTSIWEAYNNLGGDYHRDGMDTRGKILEALGVDKNGVFSIDTLYATVSKVVPEIADGSISAADWIQEQIDAAPDGVVKLPVTYQVTEKTDEGQYVTRTETVEIEVSNLEEYQHAAEQIQSAANSELLGSSLISAFSDAQIEAEGLKEFLTTIDENATLGTITGQISACKTDAEQLNDTLGESITKKITISTSARELKIEGSGQVISFSIGLAANGGIVRSAAKGTIKPGLALTGEEAPEIVWNKEKGYAYLTGSKGPEIQNLQPGDEVFNGDQTKQILKRSGLKSFAKGTISSYGGAEDKKGTLWPTGKPSGGSKNNKKDSTWRNELDWLYDLMEDIAEYERQQTILQSKYDIALKDITTTGRDLFKLTQKELINLETQLDAQEAAQLKRLQQMNELQTQVKEAGYGKYIQYNQKDQTLEIDWDRIEAIQDKDTYDEITDWISRMENVQGQMDDAEKAIWDIRAQIQELQDRYLQSYLDFQQRVLDAVVKQYQDTIDNFSDLNSTLNDTNSAILDSIQKEIDLERQIRDNTDTEKNIADMEARLAYLQRDTTGANDVEIRQLQQELTDAREDYSDTLVDQSIDRLNEANDAAAKQREKQIELMQAQLDYWQESGSLWGEVADLISAGFTQQGTIIKDSDLWEILKNADSWNSLSEAQKKNWANELILETNEVGAHLVQLSGSNDINFNMVRDSIANVGGLLTQDIRAVADEVRSLRTALTGKLGGTPEHSYTTEKVEGYASGGLNTKTGPTMLHGTPSEPEYVLNARQTDAFLRLADVLPGVFNTSSTITNTYGGNSTFNVEVNVESISNDYDVDNLVARIKEDLYNAASYRNGNPLGFLR